MSVTLLPKRANDWASSQPMGPAADHRQALRQFGQGEYCFVGKIAGLFQPRYGWGGGTGAGADGGFLEAQRLARHLDRIGTAETPLTNKHVDPQFIAETAGRVVLADISPQAAHPFHGGAEIEAEAGTVQHPEFSRGARIMERPRCPDYPLGWHTANIQAVAPQQMPLDQRHFCPQIRRRRPPISSRLYQRR